MENTISFSGLFSKTFDFYKANFRTMIKILAVLYLVPQAILIILQNAIESSVSNIGAAIGFSVVTILFAIANIFISAIMYIAIIQIIASKKTNTDFSFGDIFNKTKKYIGPYVGLSIVQGLAIFGLFLLLIIPGVIFSVFWSLSIYALILDNKSITESMKESKRLVEKNWWRTFGYGLLLGIIIMGVFFILGLGLGIITVAISTLPYAPLVSQILQSAITMFAIPIGIIFYELYYQKLKAQKSGVSKAPAAK